VKRLVLKIAREYGIYNAKGKYLVTETPWSALVANPRFILELTRIEMAIERQRIINSNVRIW